MTCRSDDLALSNVTEFIKPLLKATVRALYDASRQERAFEKGAMPAERYIPVRAVLVRITAPGEERMDEEEASPTEG